MTAKTFSKEIREKNIKHAIKCYTGVGGKRALLKDIKTVKKDCYNNNYTAIRYLVSSGCFLVSYHDQREYIRKLLKESREESEKYSDDKVYELYSHMIARDLSTIPELKE